MPLRRAAPWRVWPPVWRHAEAPIPPNSTRARRVNAALAETTASFSSAESPTVEQMARFGELNLAFHKALIALAKSPMLQLSLERVQSIAFASPAAVVTPAEPGGYCAGDPRHEAILRRHSNGRCQPVRKFSFASMHGLRCAA